MNAKMFVSFTRKDSQNSIRGKNKMGSVLYIVFNLCAYHMLHLEQERSSDELKAFLDKFGTLRIVDSGEGTPDALFGKLNAVVVAMIQEVSGFMQAAVPLTN